MPVHVQNMAINVRKMPVDLQKMISEMLTL